MEKRDHIKIRISKTRKQHWKKICKEKNITLTNLIIASVENRILEDELRKVVRKHCTRKYKKYPMIVPTIFVQ